MLTDTLNRKKLASDMILSIASSALPIVVLQLIILPIVSRQLGDDRYGMVVTIISYINVLPSAMGNVINNIRLLYDRKYRNEGQEGDFNVILLGTFVINVISLVVFTFVYRFDISVIIWLMICIVSILVSAYEYYSVAFRITLDYVATLISNIYLSLGFLLGFLLFIKTDRWPLIYILGYAAALCYILVKMPLWKEKLRLTVLFADTIKESGTLFAAGLIARLINYADKLIIYPMLGGEEVAIYYAASVIGKMISMMISPISNVVLSYLARMKKRKDNVFWMVFAISGVVGLVGYFICLLVSRFILQILYPQYLDIAITYIPLTTATAVIVAMTGIMNPFVLKFVAMKWQILINSITLTVYVLLAMFLFTLGGMIGFCWGVLIANVLKLAIIILIYRGGRLGEQSDVVI